MLKLFGLSHKNPTMSPQDARKYLSYRREPALPHWV